MNYNYLQLQSNKRKIFLSMTTTLLVMVLLCCPPFLLAQIDNLKFDRLSLEQGLSQSNIQWILQDRYGFMWFSTQDGLNMYDGYSFTVYRHDPQDLSSIAGNFLNQLYEDRNSNIWAFLGIGGISMLDRNTGTFVYYSQDAKKGNSLSGNIVTAVHHDKDNMMWIGTNVGLDKLDLSSGIFTHYRYVGKDSAELQSNIVNIIYEDKSGIIWFGTNYGLKKYDGKNDQFSRYSLSLSNPVVTTIKEDKHGNLWVGTKSGLNKFETNTGKFTSYKNYPHDPNSLIGENVTSLLLDHDNNVWIGTTEGLAKFNERTSTFTRYSHTQDNPHSLSNNNITSLYEDSYGLIWIITADRELNVFDKKINRFKSIKHNPYDEKSLSHNEVNFVFEDRSATLWIGTYGGGINKLSRKKLKFNLYRHDPLASYGLNSNSVSAIYEDRNGILWIGTQDNGLNRFDRKHETVQYFNHDPNRKTSLSSNAVTAIMEDNDGILWIGTRSGLNTFDEKTISFHRMDNVEKNIPAGTTLHVNALLQDRRGFIWIATEIGLFKYDKATNSFKHFTFDQNNPKSISSNNAWCLFEDSDGDIWIGTAVGGMNKFIPETEEFQRFMYSSANPIGLNNRTVTVIYESKQNKNNLWIGTYSGGLNLFDKTTGSFKYVTEKDGLSNNRVNGILEDDKGYLWISTIGGLTKFNPITMKTRVYDFTDGLQSNEFIRGAYCKTRAGEMFFGGINGMNNFFPTNIRDNQYIPSIVLSAFKKFDKPIRFDRAVSLVQEVQLSYVDNFFSIEFAALDYTAPQKNQFAYMMEGFDENWILSGSRRYASYTNLDPGTYTFRFKGSNNDGIWNESGSSIIISITPPFYKTIWFRILAGIFIVGFVYGSYRLRVRNIHSQKKKLEEDVKQRTQELLLRTNELQKARDLLEHRVLERTVELRESNESLRKLKEFNENVVQTMAEGILVDDENERITYVNPAFARLLGYSVKELIGKRWSELVPSNLKHVARAAQERRKEGIVDHYEMQVIRKDGSRITLLIGGSPLFENEKFVGTIGVFTDLSERIRSEDQIKNQAALIDNAHDAIAVCDLEGKISYWNKSAELIYGWKQEEIQQKNVNEVLYQEYSPEIVDALRTVLEKGEWTGELQQVAKNGKGVIVDSRWTLLNDREGFPKSILLINTDITEKVKLQMQFLRTQRLESLGTLASGIAHDLNNVLAPILMAVQILKRKFSDDASQRMLVTLETSAKRGSDIVKQVLTFARGAEGKRDELQPKHLVKEIQSLINETFPKSIVLKSNIQNGTWTVSGDATHLHQVLLNLCVNARDAMPQGGTLSIALENISLDETYVRLHPQAKQGSYVVFTVSDTGTGITPEVMENIFEPFFTTKGIGKVTGLGLSTVNGIIKEHGGFITVYSEVNAGTTFKVYLPAGASAGSMQQDPKQAVLPAGNGELLLVVDDEAAIRQVTKGTLETFGYKVITANDGIEAEMIYREHQNNIALVLTDMMMPSRDGSATVKVLTEINPSVKIIITSGLVSHDNLASEITGTVKTFLPKPYTAERLLRTIHEVLTE
ncbi:MAG: PAS domain S-box protein [Ignavibacteriales bacterium]|nr:PAS domain S-box protein [Ignavibacteriales bacterium]